MTQIPEGRQPMQSDDMAKLHPSTWEAEAKALRARVQELEAENQRLKFQIADDEITAAEQIGALTHNEAAQARAALQKQEGATHSYPQREVATVTGKGSQNSNNSTQRAGQ